jgi:hypothetical protein
VKGPPGLPEVTTVSAGGELQRQRLDKTHAAPVSELSKGPPRMAVLPSPDSATDLPWTAFPTAPVPTSLLPCWVQTPPLRVKTHATPSESCEPARNSGVAVGGQCDGDALVGVCNRAAADQLAALLGPRQCCYACRPTLPHQ